MDNLKCNRLTCRRVLTEKAVVTTCSHIFCVDCANELFNASRLCPACDTSLTEPDDVVVCSLHPSNDYKTSVLSGLNPAIIIEICGRALSFWQYQVHQEHSFQQAVVRNLNEKNAQLQKDLGNVVREANGEISLLNNKIAELQRDLELERRKALTMQDSLKEREKEYQKLKAQHDKIKRKALLQPGSLGHGSGGPASNRGNLTADEAEVINRVGAVGSGNSPVVDVSAVVGGMEASGIQRTPIGNRTMQQGPAAGAWRNGPSNHSAQNAPGSSRHTFQRQPFNAPPQGDGHLRSRSNTTLSDQSDSANEVENLLNSIRRPATNAAAPGPGGVAQWSAPRNRPRGSQRVFAQPSVSRSSGGFRPAGDSIRSL